MAKPKTTLDDLSDMFGPVRRDRPADTAPQHLPDPTSANTDRSAHTVDMQSMVHTHPEASAEEEAPSPPSVFMVSNESAALPPLTTPDRPRLARSPRGASHLSASEIEGKKQTIQFYPDDIQRSTMIAIELMKSGKARKGKPGLALFCRAGLLLLKQEMERDPQATTTWLASFLANEISRSRS